MNGKKARLIVTWDCPRQCENCCNQEAVCSGYKDIDSILELRCYDEVMITGGEPLLYPEQVVSLVKTLRNSGYKGKIYLYTAYAPDNLREILFDIVPHVDGIQFTLHDGATSKDVADLRRFSSILSNVMTNLHKIPLRMSNRLSIDKRLYEVYDFSNITMTPWAVVRKLVWLVEYPLPENEELFVLRGAGEHVRRA